MTWLWVSPHLDDAALSCAGAILRARAAGHDVVVATVFSSGEALHDQRRREDQAALALLGARPAHLGFPDAPFRAGLRRSYASLVLKSDVEPALVSAVGGAIARLARDVGAARIFFPLGVGRHVDHRTVFAAHQAVSGPVAFYEDRPYAFAAALVDLRLAEIGAAAGAPDIAADRAPDPAPARSALEAAFRDLPFLRAYLPGDAERAAAISAHLALVAGRPAPAPFALHAIDTIFSAEELRAAARAVACYRSQVIDLFGAEDAPAIARAYAAASSRLRAGAPFAERCFRRVDPSSSEGAEQ